MHRGGADITELAGLVTPPSPLLLVGGEREERDGEEKRMKKKTEEQEGQINLFMHNLSVNSWWTDGSEKKG